MRINIRNSSFLIQECPLLIHDMSMIDPSEPVSYSGNESKYHYSVLNAFTGFCTTALMTWVLMVMNAINTAVNPASANTHQSIFILYAKSCSQLCIANQQIGIASTSANKISFRKSVDNKTNIC